MLEQVRKWILTLSFMTLSVAALIAALGSHTLLPSAHADEAGATTAEVVKCVWWDWRSPEKGEASLQELRAAGVRDFEVVLSGAKYLACGMN